MAYNISPQTFYLEVCHDIKIRTERWGNENSYQIGECSSQRQYGNKRNYEENCCLAPGTYTLDCKCSYGDGWHGGYIEIDGIKYCQDFTDGFSKSVTVNFDATSACTGGDGTTQGTCSSISEVCTASGKCKCRKATNAAGDGDGTTQGSCASGEICQANGQCTSMAG